MERQSNGQGGRNSPKELPYRGSIPKFGVWTYELYMAGLLIVTFLTDQGTKTLVRENLVLGASIPADGFFRITHIYNTGSAFGLFPNQTFLLMLASLVGIAILVLFFRNQPIPPLWLRTALGLQLGGAAGNLVDRITLGHVTDFIDIGVWPVFNVADSSIMLGIIILSWFILRSPKETIATSKTKVSGDETTVPQSETVNQRESQQ